jgi:hypothetical protein
MGYATNIQGTLTQLANFSLDEINTHQRWIDGKEIYRKVIPLGPLPNASSKAVKHGVASIENLITMYGAASNEIHTTFLTLPTVALSGVGQNISIYATNEKVTVNTGTVDRRIYTNAWVVLEYTKA